MCSKLPPYPAAGQVWLTLLTFDAVAVLMIIPRYWVNVAGGKLLSLPECHGIKWTCIVSKDSTYSSQKNHYI